MCVHHFHLEVPINSACIGRCIVPGCNVVKVFPFGFLDAIEYAQRHHLMKKPNPGNVTEAERLAYVAYGSVIQRTQRRVSKRMSIKEDNF